MQIREADLMDCMDIWKWRNDPVTRQNSFNTEKISWTEHHQWYNKALASSNIKLLIANNIGIVKFEKKGSWEISINIAPDKRNKGYGSQLLSKSLNYAGIKFGINSITAEIKETNKASIRIFEKSGFYKIYSRKGICVYKKL